MSVCPTIIGKGRVAFIHHHFPFPPLNKIIVADHGQRQGQGQVQGQGQGQGQEQNGTIEISPPIDVLSNSSLPRDSSCVRGPSCCPLSHLLHPWPCLERCRPPKDTRLGIGHASYQVNISRFWAWWISIKMTLFPPHLICYLSISQQDSSRPSLLPSTFSRFSLVPRLSLPSTGD